MTEDCLKICANSCLTREIGKADISRVEFVVKIRNPSLSDTTILHFTL